MKSLVSVGVRPHGGSPASRRPSVHLLGIVPAALLLSGLFAVWAGPAAMPVAATTPSGSVVAWGGGDGQSTVPAGLSGVIAVSAGGYHSLALKSNGTVVAWGDNYYDQSTVPAGLSGVTAISAGYGHSLALKSDGTVVAWGWNDYGQTDVPAGLSGVIAVSAGWYHNLALEGNGTVVAWGDNYYGQSTVPDGLSGVTAIAAGDDDSLALTSAGTVVAWGLNQYGQTDIPAGLSGVTAIAAGAYHSLALQPTVVTTLSVSGIANPYVAGAAHSVTVTAKNTSGNVATGYRGTVHFTSSDAKAKLPANYTFTTADAGVHTFSSALSPALTLKTAGTQWVRARDTVTSTITGVQSGIVVKPAAVKTLVVSGLTTPRTAGTAGNIRVTAVDAYGNRVSGYRGTVHFTSSDAKAKLPANYKFTATDAGTHTFVASVILKTAGTQSVTATDMLTKTIKGAQTGIVVKAAAVKTLTVSGLTTPRTKGVAGTIRVTAVDAYGNRVSGYTGTVHFTSSDAKAKLPANYKFKATDAGTHVFSVTLKTAGTQSVTATDTVTKTIKGSQTGIVVAPGVTFVSLPNPAPLGGVAHLQAQTSAGAKCTIVVIWPAGNKSGASGLTTSPIAGANGIVSWDWNVAKTTKSGTAKATVTCTLNGASGQGIAQFPVG